MNGLSVAATLRDWQLYSMVALGLLGTGHCVGMCGPLVLALPGRHGRLRAHLLYHLGRITTYTIVGALLGAIGAGLAGLGDGDGSDLGAVAQVQVVVSLISAALLLLFGLVRLGVVGEPAWMAVASPAKLPGFAGVQRRAAKGQAGVSLVLLGLMLGLLPCGLSFAAFAAALPAGGPWQGGARLLAFGLGTLPGLLLLGTLAAGFARKHARLFDLLAGLLLLGMGGSLAIDALFALARP
ncbi:MAG: sulfite exporter TauE/SafE family protein [Deltaproteobacteria bacterium]|nr:sulfite exporter TauE/SafE family protein [Deltaproteobacteria bacterium]